MKFAKPALAITLSAGLALPVAAQFSDLKISEVYIGLSGPDGTDDWIEITNTGAGTVDVAAGDLFYDDLSADITEGGDLPAFTLGAGEGIVVLVSSDADQAAFDAFNAVWGGGIRKIATDGGGLGQGGDTANLLDNTGAVIDSFSYTDLDALPLGFDPAATFDVLNGGGASVLGVGGAFESNPFFNDDTVSGPDEMRTIIGSPVPEPGTLVLLGLGAGAALLRRRTA